jgi:hypothetical protein
MNLKPNKENQNNNDNHIKFGCYIYQDGLGYKDILHIISECERLGYDSIWIKDNYIPWIQDYPALRSINNKDTNNTNYSASQQNKNQNQLKQKHQEEHESRDLFACTSNQKNKTWCYLSQLI